MPNKAISNARLETMADHVRESYDRDQRPVDEVVLCSLVGVSVGTFRNYYSKRLALLAPDLERRRGGAWTVDPQRRELLVYANWLRAAGSHGDAAASQKAAELMRQLRSAGTHADVAQLTLPIEEES